MAGDIGAKLHTGRSRNDRLLRTSVLHAPGGAADRRPGHRPSACPAREGGGGRGRIPSRVHAHAARPARPSRTSSACSRMGAGPRLRQAVRHARAARRVAARRRRPRRFLAPSRPGCRRRGLGFRARFENSLDAVADRDFVAETLFDWRCSGSTCRGSARSSSSGPQRSSASRSSTTPMRQGARCSLRRRTPTSPSW